MAGESTLQQTFFDVIPADLQDLAPSAAVSVLRQMLWAESYKLGLRSTDVEVPFSIFESDGGIDAIVESVPKIPLSSLLRPPKTSFQVKAGADALRTNGEIESLLIIPSAIQAQRREHRGKNPKPPRQYTAKDINTRIHTCLEQGGTFITLLFGNDGVEADDNLAASSIVEFLTRIDPKYKDAKVEVWRQSKICGLIRHFPAIASRVKHKHSFPLLRRETWASLPEMTREFVMAPPQKEAIGNLRKALRNLDTGSTHIRVCGEPGIGKTRLILEATGDEDLAATLLYANSPEALTSDVVAQLDEASEHSPIILVVDECNAEERTDLNRRFKSRRPNLKIISIFMEEEESDSSREYLFFPAPKLPDEQIVAIFRLYGVSEPPRDCRRLQLLRRWSHDEQDHEQVLA